MKKYNPPEYGGSIIKKHIDLVKSDVGRIIYAFS